MVQEALGLIEKIIEEHKVIIGQMQTLEQVSNDATALARLDMAKSDFMPGRFGQEKTLEKLMESLEIIDKGLTAHFDREETALLAAVEKHGGQTLVSTLQALLEEHEPIRIRLAHAKTQVAELMGGKMSRHVWEASAYDVRAHITHTAKFFQTHAHNEQDLLLGLRKELRKEAEAK